MNKNIIKKHLAEAFLSEESEHASSAKLKKVQADSKKFNTDNQKEVTKTMKKAEEPLKSDEEPVKYTNDEDQQKYVDEVNYHQGSIGKPKFDNPAGEKWEEMNKMAQTGKGSNGKPSTLGNSVTYENVIPSDQAGFTGEDANEEFYNNKREFEKKAKAADVNNFYDNNTPGIGDKNSIKPKLKENKIEKMKRLVFKKEFKGVENALNLIPEAFKVDNKEFHMTDGNEKYEIKWEGSLTEGRAVILKASDKNLMTEDMAKMKHLMGYSSKDTLGTVKGAARLDENSRFEDVLNKTKGLISEMELGDKSGFSNEGNLEGNEPLNELLPIGGIDVKKLNKIEKDFLDSKGKSKSDLSDEEKEELKSKLEKDNKENNPAAK